MLDRWNIRAAWALLLSASLLAATTARAQTFQGGIRGTVRDATGVIPQATVRLLNEATGIAREVRTNRLGEYSFVAVNPSTYTLDASMPDYKTFEQAGVRIATQQFITLDILLEPGALAEQVTVVADVPPIETSNASIGVVIDRQELETTPNRGRNPFLLAVTIPTVIPTGNPRYDRQQDQNNSSLISIGGGPRRGNSYLLDGVPITDLQNRAAVIPSLAAVDEVRVQVRTYDAEMGRAGGGVFNATMRSGTSEFHGSGLFQTRPTRWLGRDYFDKQRGLPRNDDQYYRLWSGSLGGPIVPRRTFFWATTEGYRQNFSRHRQRQFPTALERAGDFSQTYNRQGDLVVIYDPATTRPDPNRPGEYIRDPFPGNVIPPGRIDTVGRNIVNVYPQPHEQRSDGTENYFRSVPVVDHADQMTVKIDDVFSDQMSLSGLYVYNRTTEPAVASWDANTFADPNGRRIERRVQVGVVNSTIIPSDSTVVSLRFGSLRFVDDTKAPEAFDLDSLGFSPSFTQAVQFETFPSIYAIEQAGAQGPTLARWSSWGFNGRVAKLVGRHSLTMGGEFRRLGLRARDLSRASGLFLFGSDYTTGPDPLQLSAASGSPVADLLLGLPVSNIARLTNPLDVFSRYYAAFLQDDFRVSSSVTLNLGLRYDYEEGLQEAENRFTVGFDSDVVSPLNDLVTVPGVDTLRGGLIFAGVNGASTRQGSPSAARFAPRLGLAWRIGDRTVIRGGYGLFWGSFNYPAPFQFNYGQTGYSLQTVEFEGPALFGTTSLQDPFPSGLQQPLGSQLGLLAGVGSRLDIADPESRSPLMHQYSADVQRQIPGDMTVSLGYVGARGAHLGLGGTNDSTIDLNVPDPAVRSLGNALNDQLPNPFFGVPEAGSLATRTTLPRQQILRPFPQFYSIYAHRVSKGRSRYHAFVVQLTKRLSRGWAGRVSYTWSRLEDNQFGESNAFALRPNTSLAAVDPEADFAPSLVDVAHRMTATASVELPFGRGRRFLSGPGLLRAVLGGWTIAGTAVVRGGFPLAIFQYSGGSGLYNVGQRPNIVPGVDPNTPGSTVDRLDQYINPAAYEMAAPFTFGNAPRTDIRIRTPGYTSVNLALWKSAVLASGTTARFGVEVLNATNTPAFTGPNTGFGHPGFGRITQQVGYSRQTQISFRLTF